MANLYHLYETFPRLDQSLEIQPSHIEGFMFFRSLTQAIVSYARSTTIERPEDLAEFLELSLIYMNNDCMDHCIGIAVLRQSKQSVWQFGKLTEWLCMGANPCADGQPLAQWRTALDQMQGSDTNDLSSPYLKLTVRIPGGAETLIEIFWCNSHAAYIVCCSDFQFSGATAVHSAGLARGWGKQWPGVGKGEYLTDIARVVVKHGQSVEQFYDALGIDLEDYENSDPLIEVCTLKGLVMGLSRNACRSIDGPSKFDF